MNQEISGDNVRCPNCEKMLVINMEINDYGEDGDHNFVEAEDISQLLWFNKLSINEYLPDALHAVRETGGKE